MATLDHIRSVVADLPRSYEVLIRDRVKFRVGRIVYLAFSPDETLMGFAFPKEERRALVESDPERFVMPESRDLRYHWVVARLDRITDDEATELALEAWAMVVPKKVSAEYFAS